MKRHALRAWAMCLICLAAALAGFGAHAGEVQARVKASGELLVCIWPAYQGISWREPRSRQLVGLDIDMAQALAVDLDVKVRFVDSSFPTFVDDLNGNRCDVAMFGIGMLAQRLDKVLFSNPYLESDIYAVSTRTSRVVRQWRDIDQPGVKVGVQAGTFMEPVMREQLRNARLVTIQLPQTRERELMAGRIDVFMTDYPYGRTMLKTMDWATLLAPPQPFHVLPYAYASKRGDTEWQQTLDAFVIRIRQDGRLDAAAKRHGLSSMVVR